MIQRYKSKPEHDRLVQDESARPVERASAMKLLSYDHLYLFELLAAEWLHHKEPMLREAAVGTLVGFWNKIDYVDGTIRLLRSDPDAGVRVDAASALAMFARFSKEADKYKEQIVRELARALTQDRDWAVQKRCYELLLELLAPEKLKETREVWDEREKKIYNLPAGSRQWEFTELFDRSRDVDWEMLKPYMDTSRMLRV